MKLPRRLRATIWMMRRLGKRPNGYVEYEDNGDVRIVLLRQPAWTDVSISMPFRDAVMLHKRLGEAIAARRQA